MIKYAFRDLRLNKVMSAIIAIQTLIIFLVFIGMMSVLFYRYDLYHHIEKMISGEGQVLRVQMMAKDSEFRTILSDSREAEKTFPHTSFTSTYKISFRCGGHKKINAVGYDETLAFCHKPKMAAGVWLNHRKKKTNEIDVVVAQPYAQNGRYKLGETISVKNPDGRGGAPVRLRVAGIISDHADLIGYNVFNKNYTDTRSFYWNYIGSYYKKPRFFLVKKDLNAYLAKKNVNENWKCDIYGIVFVKFHRGTTTEEMAEFYDKSKKYSALEERNTFEVYRHDGKKYIYEQTKTMIPVIIAILLLTLISTASNVSIMVEINLKKYGIYYIEGLTWGQCIGINICSFVVLDGIMLFLSIAGCMIASWYRLAGKLFIHLDYREILACLAVFLFLNLCSASMILRRTWGRSAKDVLYLDI